MESLLRRDNKLCGKNFTKNNIWISPTRETSKQATSCTMKGSILFGSFSLWQGPYFSAHDHRAFPLCSKVCHEIFSWGRWKIKEKRGAVGKGCCMIYKVLESLVNPKLQMFWASMQIPECSESYLEMHQPVSQFPICKMGLFFPWALSVLSV